MSNFICDICGKRDCGCRYYFEQFTVECCSSCGHGRTIPILAPAELDQLYTDEYFDGHYKLFQPGEKEFAKKIRHENHRVNLLKRHISAGTILDVGCGYGYFLYACKTTLNQGYDVLGYDITAVNKAYIEKQLTLPLVLDPEELVTRVANNGKFHCITLWHSLEHFAAPEEILRFFLPLLADQGVIIIDVPVHDSIDAAMKGLQWEGWSIPFHQHHFTSASLDKLLRKCSLEVVSSHGYFSSHIYKRLKKTWLYTLFARRIARRFQGGSKVVVCRKHNG